MKIRGRSLGEIWLVDLGLAAKTRRLQTELRLNDIMSRLFKIPLVLEPQKEGGWTVTSPVLPELVTEVDDLKELDNVVRDAVNAVMELYEDTRKEFPPNLIADGLKSPVWFESLIFAET